MPARSALVVDDSKSARFALRRYLENRHYRVEAVGSAEEAFSFLSRHRPGVIFLDHIMPGTDGFDALRAIKADAQLADIPVIICSSHEGSDFISHALRVGASGVLEKPPNPDTLTRILEELQGRRTEAPPVMAATAETDQWSFDLSGAAAPVRLTAESPTMSAQTRSAPLPGIVRPDLVEILQARLGRVEDGMRELRGELAAIGSRLDAALASLAAQEVANRTAVTEAQLRMERAAESLAAGMIERFARALLNAVERRPGEEAPATDQ